MTLKTGLIFCLFWAGSLIPADIGLKVHTGQVARLTQGWHILKDIHSPLQTHLEAACLWRNPTGWSYKPYKTGKQSFVVLLVLTINNQRTGKHTWFLLQFSCFHPFIKLHFQFARSYLHLGTHRKQPTCLFLILTSLSLDFVFALVQTSQASGLYFIPLT